MNPVAGRSGGLRLLVFVPARRSWPGGSRGTINPATVVSYLALRADGSVERAATPMGRLPKARAIDLVFDCRDVYTTTIEAPRLSDAKLRQALPNLLEERMLVDPADCHFASMPTAGSAQDTGTSGAPEIAWISVAAIDQATLARTLEACAQAQLQPRAAYSEIYTLPRPREGTLCLRSDRGRGVMRTGADQGCAFDLADGAPGAIALAKHQLAVSRLRVYGQATEGLRSVAAALGMELEEARREIDINSIADSVNLLQGSYASGGGFGFTGRILARLTRHGTWKAPAAWIGICAAIGIGGLNAYWLKLDSQFTDLRQSMRHAFRDAFPNETTIEDELAQAKRSVAALRTRVGRPSADDFSVLNSQALQVFASAPVGIVAAIEYTDRNYVVRFKPGSVDRPELRNSLQARAMARGLTLRFDADGAAHLAPLGG